MKLRDYLIEGLSSRKQLWDETFEGFLKNENKKGGIEEVYKNNDLVYRLTYKKGNKKEINSIFAENKSVKEKVRNGGTIPYIFYFQLVRENLSDIKDKNILRQFINDPDVKHQYNKLEQSKKNVVKKEDVREFIKNTNEYIDYKRFLDGMVAQAEIGVPFTGEDAKVMASKFNLTIDNNVTSPRAAGQAVIGAGNISIRKQYQSDIGVGTFFHEITHSLLVTKDGHEPGTSSKTGSISKSDGVEIFDILGQTHKGMYRSSQTERYARLFQVFFTNNKELKSRAPNLYKRVFGLLEDIAIGLVIKNHYGGLKNFKKIYADIQGD